ncbi:MAG: LytR family transcriptional regulator [Firmicutes bacterium]|nr:LytR family transcriptional regulator [Bacillota bacterium]
MRNLKFPNFQAKAGFFGLSHRWMVGLAIAAVFLMSAAFVFTGFGRAGALSETIPPQVTSQTQVGGAANQGAPSAEDTQSIDVTTQSGSEASTTTSAVESTSSAATTGESTATTTPAESTTGASAQATTAATGKPSATTVTTKETSAPTTAPTESVAPVALAGTGKINILLVGSDARIGVAGARSDSMILLTFDRTSSQIKLTSFMRDMYVAIPGHGSSKLNAAFSYGGESLLMQTLKNNFAIDVDNYITMRFESFIAVVDQIGGITLNLTQKEIDYINVEIGGVPDGEGLKQLNGAQTLSHCRNRHVGNGDFTRTARQRAAIKAIFSKIKQQHDAATLAGLVGFAMGNVKTNISADQILALATEVLDAGDVNFGEARVPFDGTWEFATKNGASVIAVDYAANQERIRQFLDG